MEDKIRSAFLVIHADDALIDDTLAYLRSEAKKQQHKTKRFTCPMKMGAVAAMALLVIGIFSHNLFFTATAHISIDVNPSVELRLNRFDRVIDTYAFNEDGANILRETNLRGKSYDEAALLFLSAIDADGYIPDGALILMTVQAKSSDKEQLLCEALLPFLEENMLIAQPSAEIEIFPVSLEIWENAHGCHMSPAKYLAIQELLEADESATLEDYADTSIRQIRQRTRECQNRHNTESNGNSSKSHHLNRHSNRGRR